MFPLAFLAFLTPPADFAAGLNAKLAEGVTPENNAHALLVGVFGPAPGGYEPPDAYFRLLGVASPPKAGAYFADARDYAKRALKGGAAEEFDRRRETAAKRPWTAKEFPDVAAWLRANEVPLSLAVEASKRPRYFAPKVSIGKDRLPIGALLYYVQHTRGAAEALAIRAMLRVSENKPAEAWADLTACHRLAAHVTQGGSLIELLVGYALDATGCRADAAFAEHVQYTADEWRAKLKEYDALPPFAPLARSIDLNERAIGLDCMAFLFRFKSEEFQRVVGVGELVTPEDWALVTARFELYYDKALEALEAPGRASRVKGLAALDREFHVPKNLRVAKPAEGIRMIADTFVGMFTPALAKMMNARDRAEQIRDNTRLALALAAYKADAEKYPARLAELEPKYVKAVRPDVFSGKGLIYKPKGEGYILYGVGENGEDDGGRSRDDTPPGDDLVIRVPGANE